MIYEVPVIDPGYVLALVTVAFLAAFFLAFAIGANDVANSFGTSVGSGVLSLRQAYAVAVVFEILGSVLIGYRVSETVRKDIVDVAIYRGAEATFLMGEVSALGGSCLWILIATFLRIPVSATHSVVGATLGFSLVARGFNGIQWHKIAFLALSWLTSPFLSGLFSCMLFALLRRFVLSKSDPIKPGLKLLPLIYAFTLFINAIATLMNGSKMLGFDEIEWYNSLMLSVGLGVICGVLVFFWLVPWQRAKLFQAAQHRRLQEQLAEQRTAVYASPDSPNSFHRSNQQGRASATGGAADLWDSEESLCDFDALVRRLRDASMRSEYSRNDVNAFMASHDAGFNNNNQRATAGTTVVDVNVPNSQVSFHTKTSVQDIHRSVTGRYGNAPSPIAEELLQSVSDASNDEMSVFRSRSKHDLYASKYRLPVIYERTNEEEEHSAQNHPPKEKRSKAIHVEKLIGNVDAAHPHNITIVEETGSKQTVILQPLVSKPPDTIKKQVSNDTATDLHADKPKRNQVRRVIVTHAQQPSSSAARVTAAQLRDAPLQEPAPQNKMRVKFNVEEASKSSGGDDDISDDAVDSADNDDDDDDAEESDDDGGSSGNSASTKPQAAVQYSPSDSDSDDQLHMPKSSVTPAAVQRDRTKLRAIIHDCAERYTEGCVNEYTVNEAEIRERENRPETKQLFAFVQVLTGAFASFAHGGNDVSNAIGPLTAIWFIYQEGRISSAASPMWLLFYGGIGIACGLCVMGSYVIETIGADLTPLTPTSGFCAELGTAFTVLVASRIGIPISTTHCIVGSVVSVGWFRSRQNVNLRLFRNIFLTWLITLPASMLCAAVIMILLNFASVQ